MFRQVAKTVSYKFFVTLSSSRKHDILIFVTVADWDIMCRVITQARGQAFQTLGQAFGFLLRLQKLNEQMFEKRGCVF